MQCLITFLRQILHGDFAGGDGERGSYKRQFRGSIVQATLTAMLSQLGLSPVLDVATPGLFYFTSLIYVFLTCEKGFVRTRACTDMIVLHGDFAGGDGERAGQLQAAIQGEHRPSYSDCNVIQAGLKSHA
jgi:hypothetical protein